MTPSQAKRRPKRKPKRAANECSSTASYGRAIARACDMAFPVPVEIENDEQLREELNKQWRRDHRWSPNQLRHAFATNMRKQVGLEATRTMMGHTSAVVTEIYAEADYKTEAKIMAKAR